MTGEGEGKIACVAWRFWLGVLSNKGGRGQRNREEIGAGATWATFIFLAASPLVLARFAREFRRYAATPLVRPAFLSQFLQSPETCSIREQSNFTNLVIQG